jgi:hypothetical protein
VGMFHDWNLGYVSWLGSRLGVPATGNSAQVNPMLTGNSAWRKKKSRYFACAFRGFRSENFKNCKHAHVSKTLLESSKSGNILNLEGFSACLNLKKMGYAPYFYGSILLQSV